MCLARPRRSLTRTPGTRQGRATDARNRSATKTRTGGSWLVPAYLPLYLHHGLVAAVGHARRSWLLASFSLRSGAHVLKYAPLRSSRKPRQKPGLAGGLLTSDRVP